AWKKSHGIGHSVLRDGRRVRRARRKIRSIAPSRATLARSNRRSAPRHGSNRIRHKLPPSNWRPNESPTKTHGRASRRSVMTESLLGFWWRRGFCRFTRFRWCTTSRRATWNIFVRGCEDSVSEELFGMFGQLFRRRGVLLGCHGTGVVPPLASLVCHAIGIFLVGKRFVPRLLPRRAVLLAFNCDRALQAFEHNH